MEDFDIESDNFSSEAEFDEIVTEFVSVCGYPLADWTLKLQALSMLKTYLIETDVLCQAFAFPKFESKLVPVF
jgi:hypothetical protein